MPLPLPLAPAVIVIKPLLLVAVQLQPAKVDTDMVPVPPVASKLRPVGLIEKEHTGLAFWVTVKVCPAMVSVPLRPIVSGLFATVKLTVPLPLPPLPDVIEIQGTL